MPDYRLDRLSALQLAPLLLSQRFGFTAMGDFNTGVICIDPAIAKTDKHLVGLFTRVFQQHPCLFELRRENVAVIRGLPRNVRKPITNPLRYVTAKLVVTPNS